MTWEERNLQGHGRGRVAQEKEEGREGGRCEGQGEEWRRCGLEEELHGLEEGLHSLEEGLHGLEEELHGLEEGQ